MSVEFPERPLEPGARAGAAGAAQPGTSRPCCASPRPARRPQRPGGGAVCSLPCLLHQNAHTSHAGSWFLALCPLSFSDVPRSWLPSFQKIGWAWESGVCFVFLALLPLCMTC